MSFENASEEGCVIVTNSSTDAVDPAGVVFEHMARCIDPEAVQVIRQRLSGGQLESASESTWGEAQANPGLHRGTVKRGGTHREIGPRGFASRWLDDPLIMSF
ncbi:MAG: hypothetical protein ABJM11_08525 [Marinobacter sp.]|uniref:hypothetical protein n=1 Tax=Marinobacter sp. TaxID=50741 RepID=UPI003298B411